MWPPTIVKRTLFWAAYICFISAHQWRRNDPLPLTFTDIVLYVIFHGRSPLLNKLDGRHRLLLYWR
jgi:hypothetical protein